VTMKWKLGWAAGFEPESTSVTSKGSAV